MKSSILSVLVLTLMCFTIGYGLVTYPETGLLEPVANNSSNVCDSSNLTSIPREHGVGMQPKDGSAAARDIAPSNTNSVLPEVATESSELLDAQQSAESTPPENPAPVADGSQQETSSVNPISAPQALDGDSGWKDEMKPITVPNDESVPSFDSPQKTEEPVEEEVASGRESEVVPEGKKAEEKKEDTFDVDGFLRTDSLPLENEKEQKEADNAPSKIEPQNVQSIVDNQVEQASFEQPVDPNIASIPQKRVSLDSKPGLQTGSEVPSVGDNFLSTPTSTTPLSTPDSTNSTSPLESLNPEDSTKSTTESQISPPVGLQDSLIALETEVANIEYIPVKRFPPTDNAADPMYNCSDMSRFSLKR